MRIQRDLHISSPRKHDQTLRSFSLSLSLSLSLSSFVAPAGASPHLGAYEDFILCSKSLGPTTTRMSPSDLWAIAKKLKKEPEEFLHLSSSTRKGTAADLFWTSGGVLLLQDFFSDEDQKKFCSSRVEEQKKKKKKKKEKMSFVFRGSRGDLESGLQNFMTARRNVVRSFVLSFSCCSVLYQAFLLSLSLVLVEESPMLLWSLNSVCVCVCVSVSLSCSLLKSFTRICQFGQLTASVDNDRRFSLWGFLAACSRGTVKKSSTCYKAFQELWRRSSRFKKELHSLEKKWLAHLT